MKIKIHILNDFCPLCINSVIKVVMVNLIQWFYIYDCLHSLISLGMKDSGQLNVLYTYVSVLFFFAVLDRVEQQPSEDTCECDINKLALLCSFP